MTRTRINKVLANVMRSLVKLTMVTLLLPVTVVPLNGWGPDPVKPLQLDGEVTQVRVERDRESQILHLKVKLTFTNTSEKPVILLLRAYEKKDWWVLDRTLSRTLPDALEGKPFFISPTGPANSRSLSGWKELRRQLNSSPPPSTVTQTIQPRGTFVREIETFAVIRDDDGISPGSRVWLKVLLELWPENIEPSTSDKQHKSYGESLRQKWQAFGDLQLDPILSSPIPFDLPAMP